jgi:hypothetical protein
MSILKTMDGVKLLEEYEVLPKMNIQTNKFEEFLQ